MATASDRRAQGASRIPFDAMVEVGGSLGPSFEAQALNLSEEGMSLRTMYLPEVGQPITCRFDAGPEAEVVAAGEVLWKEDMGDGGEFGIRFTNLDVPSTIALQRVLQMGEDGMLRGPSGRKVRLHIDGLASPMRARVKNEGGANVTAFSELGFLQLGKPLSLEDAASQERRPALIDRVEVEVERESRVPQLIVTLRYDDEEGRRAEHEAMAHGSIDPIVVDQTGRDHGSMDAEEDIDPEVPVHVREADEHAAPAADAADDADEVPMKSKFARGAEKARVDATKAFEKLSSRAKTTFALVAAKLKKTEEAEAPPRRMTAPPPGGALHASGRKVVRASVPSDDELKEIPRAAPKLKITKKKIAIAGAVGTAALLAMLAMRKPAPEKAAAVASPPPLDTSGLAATTGMPKTTPSAIPGMPPVDTIAASGVDPSDPATKGKPGKAVPFTNGPVGHGNVLKLKMDGAIGSIQGAASPTGFTVTLPGRKSLDSAAPLAAKDSRIAAIKVANENGGAELTVSFKDGVPNYLVKAKGDVLELHLAKASTSGEAHHGKKKKHH